MNITKGSLQKLREQLAAARELDKQINVEIEEARAQGDLSENADYSAAMEKKASNNKIIEDLSRQIQEAVVVADVADTSKVSINTKVKFIRLDRNVEKEYVIGDSINTNPDIGIISETSPLGKAMLGHKVGDTVIVETKVPYSIEILEISQATID